MRAKVRFYFETNKKNHKKLRKKTVTTVTVTEMRIKTTLVLSHKKMQSLTPVKP